MGAPDDTDPVRAILYIGVILHVDPDSIGILAYLNIVKFSGKSYIKT